ncbi:DUF2797 domain-containing protein [Halobacteria archaeon HArc-curdl5-1]|uniref:DUF2797 domain-containing protein n=1 Tax=Halapricum hydrolyticum TaxID=2979991 RepID=A0AAE3LEN5_9EURY|nr:DUF2797 domain-containing protein [Halapricum hydrolyticum]MCU4717313.1 DUF2797 domain-containing protein [Halapricum hydrolyticum]MCU4726240.1 DUF2797 domain-containing protein [Halapricum hydrolyticum]
MQIVGYETGAPDGEPALILAADGDLEREPLRSGERLALTLEERHCAGTIDGSGDTARHLACDAPEAPYCPQHTDRWPCARCTGDCNLPLETCREEHAVYLAAFAPATFKVGVTRSWRLETRLREQGADRAAHVRTVENGRIARQIEADIAADVGDRVRVPTKIEGLHRAVDSDAWADLLDAYDPIATYTFEYGLDLADRPVVETMATGTVRGSKGRVLVLERGGSTYAVDMRELVGYDVSRQAASRQLQSSLSAFE